MLLGHAAGVAAALALQNGTAARGPAAHGAAAAERGGEGEAPPGEGMEHGPAVDFHTLPRGALEAALRAEGAKLDPVVGSSS